VKNIPEFFRQRLQALNIDVIGIGGVHAYIGRTLNSYGLNYNRRDLTTLADLLINKTDQDLGSGPYASTAVSDVLYILGIMEFLGIKAVQNVMVNNATGVLITPSYWTAVRLHR